MNISLTKPQTRLQTHQLAFSDSKDQLQDQDTETDIKCQFLVDHPETDIMDQFLDPETDIMGEGTYISVRPFELPATLNLTIDPRLPLDIPV